MSYIDRLQSQSQNHLMTQRLLCTLISIFTLASFDSFASTLPGFTEIDPYRPGSSEMTCANYSRDEWKVSIENGKLNASPSTYNSAVTLKIADGIMTAQDNGEFGGGLEFVRGSEAQKIFKQNISSLFVVKDQKVVAFGGLDHMGTDEGYALLIAKPSQTSKWNIEKNIKLPANPYAEVAKDQNSFFFITGAGLYSLNVIDGKVENLKSASLSGLYPNSLVISKDGHIYTGMRYAIAHFIPYKGTYRVKWLVKKQCTGVKD